MWLLVVGDSVRSQDPLVVHVAALHKRLSPLRSQTVNPGPQSRAPLHVLLLPLGGLPQLLSVVLDTLSYLDTLA